MQRSITSGADFKLKDIKLLKFKLKDILCNYHMVTDHTWGNENIPRSDGCYRFPPK